LPWPRRRSIVCTSAPAYHTSIRSAPIRASTRSPISRAGTEYVFFFTWSVLPWLTRTVCRSSVSSRAAGSARSRAFSSANFSCRRAFRRATTISTKSQYSATLTKSRLPRSSSAWSSSSLKRRCPCSQSPFS
jgi:hypothetical protein